MGKNIQNILKKYLDFIDQKLPNAFKTEVSSFHANNKLANTQLHIHFDFLFITDVSNISESRSTKPKLQGSPGENNSRVNVPE